MALALAIAISAVLFGGFLFLTALEAKSGRRVLAPLRARLDVYASDIAHRVRKADLHAIPYTRMRTFFMHIVHEIAHGVLIVVRVIERILTRMVRTLRHKKEGQDSRQKMG